MIPILAFSGISSIYCTYRAERAVSRRKQLKGDLLAGKYPGGKIYALGPKTPTILSVFDIRIVKDDPIFINQNLGKGGGISFPIGGDNKTEYFPVMQNHIFHKIAGYSEGPVENLLENYIEEKKTMRFPLARNYLRKTYGFDIAYMEILGACVEIHEKKPNLPIYIYGPIVNGLVKCEVIAEKPEDIADHVIEPWPAVFWGFGAVAFAVTNALIIFSAFLN